MSMATAAPYVGRNAEASPLCNMCYVRAEYEIERYLRQREVELLLEEFRGVAWE